MRKLKGVYVQTSKALIEKKEFDDDIKTFYKLLDCNCIDIVSRKINGIKVRLIVDDEGLFKTPLYVSAVDDKQEPMIYGNFLIVGNDVEDGELTSLTDRECLEICDSTLYGVLENEQLVKVINNMTY